MTRAEKAALDVTLTQMRTPVRNVPFPLIVKAMCGHKVIPLDVAGQADRALVKSLKEAVRLCVKELKLHPIKRPRPNEVGNDIEKYVMQAVPKVGLKAFRPTTKTGKGRSTGYPDILIQDNIDRYTYLECKIFTQGAPLTTMRSFYLSPSASPKVCFDARHLLLAFGMDASAIKGSRNSSYKPRSFKLIDLYNLTCSVKYEFNADNRSLYKPSMILADGPC